MPAEAASAAAADEMVNGAVGDDDSTCWPWSSTTLLCALSSMAAPPPPFVVGMSTPPLWEASALTQASPSSTRRTLRSRLSVQKWTPSTSPSSVSRLTIEMARSMPNCLTSVSSVCGGEGEKAGVG